MFTSRQIVRARASTTQDGSTESSKPVIRVLCGDTILELPVSCTTISPLIEQKWNAVNRNSKALLEFDNDLLDEACLTQIQVYFQAFDHHLQLKVATAERAETTTTTTTVPDGDGALDLKQVLELWEQKQLDIVLAIPSCQLVLQVMLGAMSLKVPALARLCRLRVISVIDHAQSAEEVRAAFQYPIEPRFSFHEAEEVKREMPLVWLPDTPVVDDDHVTYDSHGEHSDVSSDLEDFLGEEAEVGYGDADPMSFSQNLEEYKRLVDQRTTLQQQEFRTQLDRVELYDVSVSPRAARSTNTTVSRERFSDLDFEATDAPLHVSQVFPYQEVIPPTSMEAKTETVTTTSTKGSRSSSDDWEELVPSAAALFPPVDGSMHSDIAQEHDPNVPAILWKVQHRKPGAAVPYDGQSMCHRCHETFTYLTKRKHRCKLCGRIFCSACLESAELPTYYDRIAGTRSWSQGWVTYLSNGWNAKVALLCIECNVDVKDRQGLYSKAFDALALSLPQLLKAGTVCVAWRCAVVMRLSLLRELQYARPLRVLSASEKQHIWSSRKCWIGHSMWIIQLLKSVNWRNKAHTDAALGLLKHMGHYRYVFGKGLVALNNQDQDITTSPTSSSGSHVCDSAFTMCSRLCTPNITAAGALQLFSLRDSSEHHFVPHQLTGVDADVKILYEETQPGSGLEAKTQQQQPHVPPPQAQRNSPLTAVRAYAVDCIKTASDEEIHCFLPLLIHELRNDDLLSAGTSALGNFLIEHALDRRRFLFDLYWGLSVAMESESRTVRRQYGILKERLVAAITLRDGNNKEIQQLTAGRVITSMFECFELETEMVVPADSVTTTTAVTSESVPLSEDYSLGNVASVVSDTVLGSVSTAWGAMFASSSTAPAPPTHNNQTSVTPIKPSSSSRKNLTTTPSQIERKKQKQEEAKAMAAESKVPVFKLMFKREDVRRDNVILSTIRLMNNLVRKELNLDLHVLTYRVLPTSTTSGFIEYIQNAETLHDIEEESQEKLINFMARHSPHRSVSECFDHFARSMAAWTIFTVLLGIGDRHKENMMVTHDGVMFHIDFGWVMGKDKPMSPKIRLTDSMIEAMGGTNSTQYKAYRTWCEKVFNMLRKHSNLFYSMLRLLAQADPPIQECTLTEDSLDVYLQERFLPGQSDEYATRVLHKWMDDAKNAFTGTLYDRSHTWAKQRKTQAPTDKQHYRLATQKARDRFGNQLNSVLQGLPGQTLALPIDPSVTVDKFLVDGLVVKDSATAPIVVPLRVAQSQRAAVTPVPDDNDTICAFVGEEDGDESLQPGQ